MPEEGWGARLSGSKKKAKCACPPVFSFIDEPEKALTCLQQFVRAVTSGAQVMNLDQGQCKTIDLCAASVLNVLALEARQRLHVSFEGTYPFSSEATEIVLATGLPKVLEVPLPEPEGFLTFRLTSGEKSPDVATVTSAKEIESERLADYVGECLGKYNFKLTPEGNHFLIKLVTEVLGNAEEHSGSREWWIAGYLRQPRSTDYGDCHLTIFNFGKTMSESLHELPPTALLRRQMEQLVEKHSSWWWWKTWTPEDLWTLYALQEGVSRLNTQAENLGTRGQGTVEMIEMFQELGQVEAGVERPRMCLVSGRTHILFDGTYGLAPRATGGGEERRVIAFNAANDLGQPPDRSSVRRLKRRFPGTLISLRFFIDPKYLERLTGQYATYRQPE